MDVKNEKNNGLLAGVSLPSSLRAPRVSVAPKTPFPFASNACHAGYWTYTLGARDFSSAVSALFTNKVTCAKSFSRGFAACGFGLGPKMCRPSANTEIPAASKKNLWYPE